MSLGVFTGAREEAAMDSCCNGSPRKARGAVVACNPRPRNSRYDHAKTSLKTSISAVLIEWEARSVNVCLLVTSGHMSCRANWAGHNLRSKSYASQDSEFTVNAWSKPGQKTQTHKRPRRPICKRPRRSICKRPRRI